LISRRFFVLSLSSLLLIIVTVLAAHLFHAPRELHVDLWPREIGQFTTPMGPAVSITPLSADTYLLCNYGEIFLFNSSTRETRVMSPGMPVVDLKKTGGKAGGLTYNPTGLFFSPATGLLYVANYTVNNILVFEVDAGNYRLLLRGEVKSPHTVSPESVWVSDDGKFLACANYDGNSVTAFDISSSTPRELWNTPIKLAHGVCMAGGHVYATGLGEKRALYELDVKNGGILRTAGKRGWDPVRTGFLWPTSVYPYSPDMLLLSDAHTGYVYCIDRRSLKIRRFFGGNGPTFRYLNMPYAAIVHGERLIVLSTFQGRLIVMDRKSFRVTDMVATDSKSWEYLRGRPVTATEKLGAGWDDGYVWRKGPQVSFFGAPYLLSYGHLYPAKGEPKLPVLSMPSSRTLFNEGGESYFLNLVTVPGGVILLTPQMGPAFLLLRQGGACLFSLPPSPDRWALGNEIYGPLGRVETGDFVRSSAARLESLGRKRMKNGLLAKNDLREVLFSSMDAPRFDAAFTAVFRTEEGKRFLDRYHRALEDPPAAEDVQAMADEYFRRIRQETFAPLDECVLVSLLTGHEGKPGKPGTVDRF